tara:strand:- start:15260 stop:17323 length:2064 start_codon:yes stop_codon:yes gene_type:complete
MSSNKRYTITAALPYTNGPIHIGHLAGVYVPADIYARYLRLTGNDVAYICGSDEHGVAIPMRAKKEGVSPQDIIDKYHAIIQQSFKDFGISFDNYSRTSSKIHHKTASDFFKNLHQKGDFIEEITEQLYDAEANQFLADRFVVGTCPKCGFEESYGDQCEQCGTSHNGTDLINPKSAITGNTPTVKKTKHWFLPLDKHEDFLRKWILEGHKSDWKPNVLGQVKSWIDDGLRPRAVTRDLEWGIPVPVNGGNGKVLYVWFDAPIGYISSTKEWAKREGKNWEDYWKDENTKLVHFIGKDNIVFHCIIFPAMLKAHGDYILPENVPANEFLNLEGNKLSTSKNWAVWLHEYLQDFPNQQDVLRYTLTANSPENKDNDFTWKDFQIKNNSELVAIFGNFVNRVVVLTNKYYNGVVPMPGELLEVDKETLLAIKIYPGSIGKSIQRYRFREASQELMNLARLGNKYLADEEPWKVIKLDQERVKTIMYVALQITAALAVVSEPFLPFTSTKLNAILNPNSEENHNTWNDVSKKDNLIFSGNQIGKAELLFSKIEDKKILSQLERLAATKKVNKQDNKFIEPQKNIIEFEDFNKLDIRVGTIIGASKVTKTKKLLLLKVDIGVDVRTIISGISESFTPEEVIGQQVTVLTNLAPRKIRGIESQGMILMTDTPNGKLAFLEPEQRVSNGQQIS